MSEKSRLFKNALIIAMGSFGAKAVSFLLLPLYTSILTTVEYGTYDYILAISFFLTPIFTLSINEGMFRFIIDSGFDGSGFKKIISHTFLIVLGGCVLLVAIMVPLNLIIGIDYVFYLVLYVIMTSLYSFTNNILRGLGEMKYYSINSAIKTLAQLLLNILAVAVFRTGVEGLFISMCFSEGLGFLVVFISKKLWKQISFKNISRSFMKELLVYSLPLVPNALSSRILSLSGRLVISAFMGAAANGIYAIAYKFPSIIETVYHYFYNAWSESASRIIAKGKDEAEKYYNSLYKIIDNAIFSVILFTIATMPIIFRILIRGDYIEGYIYVPILLVSIYFNCIGKYYAGIFTAYKNTSMIAKSTVIGAAVNLAINFTLIHFIGLYAAAIASLVADALIVIIRKRYLDKDCRIEIDKKQIAIRTVLVIVLMLLYRYDDLVLMLISIAIASVYALIDNKSLIDDIFKSVKKIINKRKGSL